MTHHDRAAALAPMLQMATSRPWIIEQLHQAMIAASNNELEQKRAVEVERDRALMGQSALLLRVAELQQHLDDLETVLEPVFELFGVNQGVTADEYPALGLVRAKEVLDLYEEGTVRA